MDLGLRGLRAQGLGFRVSRVSRVVGCERGKHKSETLNHVP